MHTSKYKIEGKYNIPIGYKAIIKWDDDEVVFMTREGSFGPEFQIIYLPKSAVAEDFTLFEWNPNIAELWDQLLTVLETQDRDMSMFASGRGRRGLFASNTSRWRDDHRAGGGMITATCTVSSLCRWW